MAVSPLRRTALTSLLLLGMLPMSNQAQAIYRCGNSYSQTPCAGGSVVDADDRRSAEQKAQTDAAAAQAGRQADRMEHERLARERAAVAVQTHASAESISSKKGKITRTKRPATANKPLAEPHFTASSGRNDKKKTEARSGN